ncbi:MAG: rhodanese-like domain-containing protein [Actinopolymorphaceae bacterium]
MTSTTQPPLSIGDLLARARKGLNRVTSAEAYERTKAGALLVDIRPREQRAREGHVEGAVPHVLVVERNVLEWRLDPASDARLPEVTGYDVDVIVMCSQGYASSLAAAALQELGLHRATDLDGGFLAWREAGLPYRDDNTRRRARTDDGLSRRSDRLG